MDICPDATQPISELSKFEQRRSVTSSSNLRIRFGRGWAEARRRISEFWEPGGYAVVYSDHQGRRIF